MPDLLNTTSANGTIVKTGASIRLSDNLNGTGQDLYDINDAAIAVAVPIVFAMIFLIGLIGNGCLISSVLRYKAMRTAPNLFIVNLAVGDVLMILISVPTSATIYSLNSWPFGLAVCKMSYFIKTLSLGVSIFTLTALSIDRVLVISQTMKIRQEKTTQRITVMVAAVWILSIIIAVPDAISYHLKPTMYASEQSPVVYCSPHPSEWKDFSYPKIHATVHVVSFFILPLIIITISYSIMAYIMVRNSHGIPGESLECSVWRKRQIETRKKVAQIVIILIALFFICWLPRSIIILYIFYNSGVMMTPAMYYARIVSYCLQFLNCCVNPIALYFLSKSFRSHYMKQLCCGRDYYKISETDLATKHSHTNGEGQVLTRLIQDKARQVETTDQTDNQSYDTMLPTEHSLANV